ncbi:hypothetical protein THAOC_33402, partial [Thalassiosira oceanica]
MSRGAGDLLNSTRRGAAATGMANWRPQRTHRTRTGQDSTGLPPERATSVQSRECISPGDLSVPDRPGSAWKVAHSKALGPGITKRPPERPGKARKASIRRKSDSSLRQRVPFNGKNAFDRVVRANRPGLGMGRKAASRKALVELYKSLRIKKKKKKTLGTMAAWTKTDAASPGGLAKRRRHPAHCSRVSKTDAARAGGTRARRRHARRTAAASGDAAASPRLTQLARGARGGREWKKTPGVLRRRQERAYDDGRQVAGARGRAAFPSSVPLVVSPRPLALRARYAELLVRPSGGLRY